MRNLELAYPEKTRAERNAIADEVFRSIAPPALRRSRAFPKSIAKTFPIGFVTKAWSTISRRRRPADGVLFATAHLGNWELSAFAHALMTEPMNVVIRPLDNPAHRPPGGSIAAGFPAIT